MPELTSTDAIKIAFDYYCGMGFSIADSCTLIDILLKAKVGGLIKFAYEQAIKDNADSTVVELVRDTFNNGYEKGYAKGYEKGKADEIQAVRQAQADRDQLYWRREIKRLRSGQVTS